MIKAKDDNWSELAIVGAAAIHNGMSYGFYVAAGMPNLEHFRRAVQKGEYVPRRRRTEDTSSIMPEEGGLPTAKKAKTSKKIDKRGERKSLICKRCEKVFEAEVKSGPLPMYCPACKVLRQKEYVAAKNAKQRAKRIGIGTKEGEILA